jgi:hypothetical protein
MPLHPAHLLPDLLPCVRPQPGVHVQFHGPLDVACPERGVLPLAERAQLISGFMPWQPGAQQRHGGYPVRTTCGDLHGNTSAVRGGDQRRLLDSEVVQQVQYLFRS